MAAFMRVKRLLVCLALLMMVVVLRKRRLDRRHKYWVRKVFVERKRFGCYYTLLPDMRRNDRECYYRWVLKIASSTVSNPLGF